VFYPHAIVDKKTTLGKHVVIFSDVTVTNSKIGDHTFIQRNSNVNHAVIGKFCSIAMGVNIGLGQHPTGSVSTHPAFYSNTQPLAKTFSEKDNFEPFRQTIIGHDVWIGQNAMIMDGIKVGTGAVIAAGSVVTKDIESYAITGGIPAKTIRYRFREKIRNRLLSSKWWNMTNEMLADKYHLFSDPELFLRSLDRPDKADS
jgi:acetyltransferase-like isoleucine patch superfamily enzyme